MAEMVALKNENPDLKVMVALGGYNAGGERFSNMASTASNRASFISSLLLYILDNRLDGMDLDWEFPGAQDRNTYTDLLRVREDPFIRGITHVASRMLIIVTRS